MMCCDLYSLKDPSGCCLCWGSKWKVSRKLGSGREGGKRWSYSAYILKIEPSRLADGWWHLQYGGLVNYRKQKAKEGGSSLVGVQEKCGHLNSGAMLTLSGLDAASKWRELQHSELDSFTGTMGENIQYSRLSTNKYLLHAYYELGTVLNSEIETSQ